jgi:hypothetical protein
VLDLRERLAAAESHVYLVSQIGERGQSGDPFRPLLKPGRGMLVRAALSWKFGSATSLFAQKTSICPPLASQRGQPLALAAVGERGRRDREPGSLGTVMSAAMLNVGRPFPSPRGLPRRPLHGQQLSQSSIGNGRHPGGRRRSAPPPSAFSP